MYLRQLKNYLRTYIN